MVTVWLWRMSNYPLDVLHLLEVSKNACWEISLLITCSDQQEPPGPSRSLLELLRVKSTLEKGEGVGCRARRKGLLPDQLNRAGVMASTWERRV